MEELLVIKQVCKRCNHNWVPRGSKIFVCPVCKSPRWNEDEGIIRLNPNALDKDFFDIMSNNSIFREDLMAIGGIVRS